MDLPKWSLGLDNYKTKTTLKVEMKKGLPSEMQEKANYKWVRENFGD